MRCNFNFSIKTKNKGDSAAYFTGEFFLYCGGVIVSILNFRVRAVVDSNNEEVNM